MLLYGFKQELTSLWIIDIVCLLEQCETVNNERFWNCWEEMLFPGRSFPVDVSSSINSDYTFDLCSENHSFILRFAPKTGNACKKHLERRSLFSETIFDSGRLKFLSDLPSSVGSLEGDIHTPGSWAVPEVILLYHTAGQEGSEVGTEIRNLFCIYSFLMCERTNERGITATIRKLKSSW